jgi:hypothetical protein
VTVVAAVTPNLALQLTQRSSLLSSAAHHPRPLFAGPTAPRRGAGSLCNKPRLVRPHRSQTMKNSVTSEWAASGKPGLSKADAFQFSSTAHDQADSAPHHLRQNAPADSQALGSSLTASARVGFGKELERRDGFGRRRFRAVACGCGRAIHVRVR